MTEFDQRFGPASSDPEVLRADIELTRRELGESVSELTHKMNVSQRTKEKTHQLEALVTEKIPAPVRRNPVPAVAASVVAAIALGWFIRRKGANST